MINILNLFRIKRFEYIYMFVMVIYMAQITPVTSRMYGSLNGNPIPFLIPIILTLILLYRNRVTFNNVNLAIVSGVIAIWSLITNVLYNDFSSETFSYLFFLYYAVFIAYIHCQVYGSKYLLIYEDIIVKLSIVSLIGWSISVLLPFIAIPLFRLFPDTGFGNNVFYIFNAMDPAKGQVTVLLRNAGCSWEPGRFAIMVCLGILSNLYRNGIRFKNNREIYILLAALITTFSTTGYMIAMFLYAVFFVKNVSVPQITSFCVVAIPIIYGIYQLDFVGGKVDKQLTQISSLDDSFSETIIWYERTLQDGEYAVVLDRFPSMAFEWQSIINSENMFLGYGRDIRNSFFYNNISSNYRLSGGFLQVVGMYGILLGLAFYILLWHSSQKLVKDQNYKTPIALFGLIIFSSISYPILCIPVFTTLWFYGVFKSN